MIKRENLVISRNPYAVQLDGMTSERVEQGGGYWRVTIPAVWFRRKRQGYNGPMRTVACFGAIREHVSVQPAPTEEFMAEVGQTYQGVDGNCLARWDGTNLWSLANEDAREAYLEVLQEMLAGHPAVPAGYDGWWSLR